MYRKLAEQADDPFAKNERPAIIGKSHSFGRNAAMMRKQQQYRTNDYKCTFIFYMSTGSSVRATDR